MAKCANKNCKKDPLNSIDAVCINSDGDFACCNSCKDEYKKQKDKFFKDIEDDDFLDDFLGLDMGNPYE